MGQMSGVTNMSIEVGRDSGSVPQLAPDLTYPSAKDNVSNSKVITGIDGSSGLVTALSLSGRWAISTLVIANQLNEDITIKLTVDNVIIWNAILDNSAGNNYLLGNTATAGLYTDTSIQCNDSFLLEVQTTTDTDISLIYVARPIL